MNAQTNVLFASSRNAVSFSLVIAALVAAVDRGYRPPKSRGPVAVQIVAGRSGFRALLSRAFQAGAGDVA